MTNTSRPIRAASAPRPRNASRAGARAVPGAPAGTALIRPVRRADLEQVIAIDAGVTGLEKRAYWQRVYRRYGLAAAAEQRHFLVAIVDGEVAGFTIGEVRDWEFGSPACGWLFAIDVRPQSREAGVGTLLLAALRELFRRAGVRKLRTMLSRDNTQILSFFRSQGMMAGPLIPLEMDLDPAPDRAAGGMR